MLIAFFRYIVSAVNYLLTKLPWWEKPVPSWPLLPTRSRCAVLPPSLPSAFSLLFKPLSISNQHSPLIYSREHLIFITDQTCIVESRCLLYRPSINHVRICTRHQEYRSRWRSHLSPLHYSLRRRHRCFSLCRVLECTARFRLHSPALLFLPRTSETEEKSLRSCL